MTNEQSDYLKTLFAGRDNRELLKLAKTGDSEAKLELYRRQTEAR